MCLALLPPPIFLLLARTRQNQSLAHVTRDWILKSFFSSFTVHHFLVFHVSTVLTIYVSVLVHYLRLLDFMFVLSTSLLLCTMSTFPENLGHTTKTNDVTKIIFPIDMCFFVCLIMLARSETTFFFSLNPQTITRDRGKIHIFLSALSSPNSYLRNRLPSVYIRARCVAYAVAFRPIDADDR